MQAINADYFGPIAYRELLHWSGKCNSPFAIHVRLQEQKNGHTYRIIEACFDKVVERSLWFLVSRGSSVTYVNYFFFTCVESRRGRVLVHA